MRCFADSLYSGILGAVVITGGNNVAVERAADLLAIFEDSGLGAYLNAAIFNNFNQINRNNFFESHDFSLFPT
jgi:hypothetical protein